VLRSPSFPAFGEAISELLDRLSIGPRYIYLHDYGAPVGFHIAMEAPERVLGLIVQNANAHRTGLGPQWDATQAYWSQPTPENEAAATAHLTFERPRPSRSCSTSSDVANARAPAPLLERGHPLLEPQGRGRNTILPVWTTAST
jgi:pimeloyl-ACP methyl ester carboxylesterase